MTATHHWQRGILALLVLGYAWPCLALDGRVVDSATGVTIADATVTINAEVVQTGADGRFHAEAAGDRIQARAPGYKANALDLSAFGQAGNAISLTPFRAKALYLSSYSVAYPPKRNAALQLIRDAGLNAVVIDIKNDRGFVDYPSAVTLAGAIGARKLTTIHNPAALIQRLHEQHLYAIARIVTFKDNLLAAAHPEWAVKLNNGELYRDAEGTAWVDPFHQEVRDYNVALAVEAAQAGFDEIQFDYVRFPDAVHLSLSQPNTQAARVATIGALLTEARQQLAPFNVYLSADVFGYVCWNLDDTHIGQKIDALMPLVDYLSPMLYPSGFQFGIPGFLDPVAHPYEIVHLSLERAEHRTGLPGVRFRPWLQDFKDYAFDRRRFEAADVAAQTRAADEADSAGWMLWNPRNNYTPMQAAAK